MGSPLLTQPPGPANFSSGPRIARPAPTTWADQETQDAQDAWQQAGAQTAGDVATAAAGRAATKSSADVAYENFMSGSSPNTAGWQPTDLSGYAPSQTSAWLAANPATPGGPNIGPGPGEVQAGKAVASTSYTDKFDPSELMNFDPSAAGQTYAQGAIGAFNINLGQQLKSLSAQEVRQGRSTSGLFDRDKGLVVTQQGNQFANALAQAAVQFSGQRESALSAGTGYELSAAQSRDAALSAASGENAQLSTTASEANAANALAEQRNKIDQYGAGTARAGVAAGVAEAADQFGLSRASQLSSEKLGAAEFQDTQGLTRATTGLDAALKRESEYMGDYNTAADRSASYTSATRDWAHEDAATAATQAAVAKANARADQAYADAHPGAAQQRQSIIDKLRNSQASVPYYG